MSQRVAHNPALKLWHTVADLSENPKHDHESIAAQINKLGFMGREVTPMEIVDLWNAQGGRDKLIIDRDKDFEKRARRARESTS